MSFILNIFFKLINLISEATVSYCKYLKCKKKRADNNFSFI